MARNIKLAGPEWEPPGYAAAPAAVRRKWWARLGDRAVFVKRGEVRTAIGAEGDKLAPRKHPRPDGASGAVLAPHNGGSRTVRLLASHPTERGVTLFWRGDGKRSWSTVLGYHADGLGRFGAIAKRDHFGISPKGRKRLRADLKAFAEALFGKGKGKGTPPAGPAPVQKPVQKPIGGQSPPAPRPAPPPRPPATSPAHDPTGVLAAAARALGRPATRAELADLAGAPRGTAVTIRPLADGRVKVEAAGPGFQSSATLLRAGGAPTLAVDYVRLGRTGTGQGARLFAGQADAAARLGVRRVVARAVRGPGLNGYYTLPRLGFDAPVPERIRAALPGPLARARRLSDLMADPAGRAWWRAHGVDVSVEFDPAPGSPSRRALDAYLASRAAPGPPRPPAPPRPGAPKPAGGAYLPRGTRPDPRAKRIQVYEG